MQLTRISVVALFGSLFTLTQAGASIGDGKPWDWSDYNSIVSRGDAQQESTCDSVASNLGIKDLACQIDHTTWDKFLQDEHKRPFKERVDTRTPRDCGGALNYFRSYSNNGSIPSAELDDAKPVLDDFKAKLKGFDCVVESTEKAFYLDYDAKKKVLTFYFTRAPNSNNGWVTSELQRLKKDFAGINKYWADGHRP